MGMHVFRKGAIFIMYDIQKANMWKRISAYIFDAILTVIAAVGAAFVLSLLFGYGSQADKRDALRVQYETNYGVEFDITQTEYEGFSEEEKKNFDDAYLAFITDPQVNRLDILLINITLSITALGVLAAFVLFELIIPIRLGHGRTLGKKIFGIAVVRTDCVRMTSLQLLVRTILGKYTIETMLPIMLVLMFLFGFTPLVCITGIALILLLQLIFIFTTRMHTPIHDMISGTVTVDMASQMIFESTEDMIEYRKRIHADEVRQSEYR